MMPPDKERGRPARNGLHHTTSPLTTISNRLAILPGHAAMRTPDVPRVREYTAGRDAGQSERDAGHGRLPVAAGTVYQPCPGRRWWVVAYPYRACDGGTHFGRSREAAVSGPRRARCGRLILLTVTGDAR
jgi:hypothetical protein